MSPRRMPRHVTSPLTASWAAVGVSSCCRSISVSGLGQFLKRDPSMLDEAIDLEYLADNLWFVGSPQTVADRIIDLQDRTGGFGHLLIVSYDATNELEPWERSLRLLMDEVRPLLQKRIQTLQSRSDGTGSMSYVALVTDRYRRCRCVLWRGTPRLPGHRSMGPPERAAGLRFDLGGMRLEISR